MCVRNSLSSGIHAAAFYYYKVRPQPITASTRLRFAPSIPKLKKYFQNKVLKTMATF